MIKYLKICHCNIRSLLKNFITIESDPYFRNYDIIVLTEAWLKTTTQIPQLLGYYNLFTTSNSNIAGGVVVYIKMGISCNVVTFHPQTRNSGAPASSLAAGQRGWPATGQPRPDQNPTFSVRDGPARALVDRESRREPVMGAQALLANAGPFSSGACGSQVSHTFFTLYFISFISFIFIHCNAYVRASDGLLTYFLKAVRCAASLFGFQPNIFKFLQTTLRVTLHA